MKINYIYYKINFLNKIVFPMIVLNFCILFPAKKYPTALLCAVLIPLPYHHSNRDPEFLP